MMERCRGSVRTHIVGQRRIPTCDGFTKTLREWMLRSKTFPKRSQHLPFKVRCQEDYSRQSSPMLTSGTSNISMSLMEPSPEYPSIFHARVTQEIWVTNSGCRGMTASK